MFILWSKQKYDNKYILFIKNSFDELKQVFEEFCEKNKDNYNINTELKEQDLDNFSSYTDDYNFYFFENENINADEPIYIFIFNEDGEGGSYYNELYFELSNSKEELLEIATEYFINESKKTKQKHIDEMLSELNTNGNYSIPFGRTYCCDMEIFEFKPYSI